MIQFYKHVETCSSTWRNALILSELQTKWHTAKAILRNAFDEQAVKNHLKQLIEKFKILLLIIYCTKINTTFFTNFRLRFKFLEPVWRILVIVVLSTQQSRLYLYVPSFSDYLQNDGPNKYVTACRRAGKTNCTICPMIQTLRDCRSSREITPNLILQQMNNICVNMVCRPTGFIQQDAHEYLRYAV